MHATKEPRSSVPYGWWWGLGAIFIVVGILNAFQGMAIWMVVAFELFGVTQVIFGFMERGRGAPRL